MVNSENALQWSSGRKTTKEQEQLWPHNSYYMGNDSSHAQNADVSATGMRNK